jgi:tRNA nucleotidyltransferase/poly(A) polymerase
MNIQHLNPIFRDIENAGGRAFIVGGAVRDEILGFPAKDVDIEVFRLWPDELQRILENHGTVDAVGKSFGVLKLGNLDFTLPRTERRKQGMVDNAHTDFDVDVNPHLSFEDACKRRDLTINAIMFDPIEKKIVDPLGGREDLARRVMQPCSERFAEDPLRVLRAMQFAGRFDLTASNDLIFLSKKIAHEFQHLSSERIQGEWEKWAMKSVKPSSGLVFLYQSGWAKHFPGLNDIVKSGTVESLCNRLDDIFPSLSNFDKVDRLTIIFSIISQYIGNFMKSELFFDSVHLRHDVWDKVDRITVVSNRYTENQLVDHRESCLKAAEDLHPASMRLFSTVMENEELFDRSVIYNCSDAPQPKLVQGKDLLELGWEPGPVIGKLLDLLYDVQLSGNYTKESLLKKVLQK